MRERREKKEDSVEREYLRTRGQFSLGVSFGHREYLPERKKAEKAGWDQFNTRICIHVSVSPSMEQSSARLAIGAQCTLGKTLSWTVAFNGLRCSEAECRRHYVATHRMQFSLPFYTIRRAKYDTRSHVERILKPAIKLSKIRSGC